MHSSTFAIATVLALSGCKGKAKDPPPPAGSAAEPVAQMPDQGSGSAMAAAPCKDVEIALAKAGHVVRRDADQPVQLDELTGALTTLATACKGIVIVTANDDMDYSSMIAATDAAKAAGFADVVLHATGGPATPHRPPRTSGQPSITNAPIIRVTKTDVSIVVGTEQPVPIGKVGDVGVEQLEAALGKVPDQRDDTPIIVQADAATSAKTINAIIVAAKTAGFHDLLFAVKNR